jgi:uncharacterized protein
MRGVGEHAWLWKACDGGAFMTSLCLRMVAAVGTMAGIAGCVDASRRCAAELALIHAAARGETSRVATLHGHGVNLTSRPVEWSSFSRSRSALEMAAAEGRVETTRWLLDHGADPNARSADGVTALWLAAADGRANTVRLLLDRGADPNLDASGFTILDAGQRSGSAKVAALLRRAGAR